MLSKSPLSGNNNKPHFWIYLTKSSVVAVQNLISINLMTSFLTPYGDIHQCFPSCNFGPIKPEPAHPCKQSIIIQHISNFAMLDISNKFTFITCLDKSKVINRNSRPATFLPTTTKKCLNLIFNYLFLIDKIMSIYLLS